MNEQRTPRAERPQAGKYHHEPQVLEGEKAATFCMLFDPSNQYIADIHALVTDGRGDNDLLARADKFVNALNAHDKLVTE